MLSLVAAAGDVRQRRARVGVAERGQPLVTERSGHGVERPRAAQIEPVEVDDLRVGAVRDDGRLQRMGLQQRRQEAPHPRLELRGREHLRHQRRFLERRREEVLAARLPADGPIAILAVVMARAFVHQRGELRVARRAGIFPHQRKAEGGVRVHAGADGVGLLWQEGMECGDNGIGERLQIGRPALRLGRVLALQLRREQEQPRPAIGALEALPVRLLPVIDLDRDVRRREVLVERRADARRLGERGKLPQEPHQHPVAVHRRVPVEAAIERRVQGSGRLHLGGVVHHVIELVGIFLLYAIEREPREAAGGRRVERQIGGGDGHGEQRGDHLFLSISPFRSSSTG